MGCKSRATGSVAICASRAFFCFSGRFAMKKMLCATDARERIGALMASALLCTTTLSGSAFAAPASGTPAENSGLEEIIVTAEKRESTVQATPIAMTALSAGDLTDQNITSIQDLVGAIPGISLRTAGPGH